MCTILLAWRCLDDARFVIAGNRDELVARPSAGPALLNNEPRIFGGRDLLAGGTWLAVRSDGAVAAVTNRRSDAQDEVARDPDLRSRGALPLAVLTSDDGARSAVARLRAAEYNPFNLLVIEDDAALVGHALGAGGLRVVALEPGLHALCVHDVDDAVHAKELRIRDLLNTQLDEVRDAATCVERMVALLAIHDTGGGDWRDALCIHGEEYGTVSSSVVWQGAAGSIDYLHAPGRPCVTPFQPVPLT